MPMFILNLKEVLESVFKNGFITLISRNKLSSLLFPLNLFATVPHESSRALSVRLHRAPKVNTQLHLVYQEYFIEFPDNPNSPESEQRSALIHLDSRGSTVIRYVLLLKHCSALGCHHQTSNHVRVNHFGGGIEPGTFGSGAEHPHHCGSIEPGTFGFRAEDPNH
ncbi:hypothetical protein AVEN_44077-1 [Araneus ventricosus]|uniref:Uncharacterized protein n=1 Tax=Araneus ventricosus TaxID=182803 RepID=A0A4Y2WTW1_ARAVE|nr:hypothetical protein AVEN_44077-1 [Araneus ventricosus]